jgi:fibronectin-binding autotransporter adhesin
MFLKRNLCLLGTAAFFAAGLLSVHGADGSWANAADGTWSTPANWTGGTIADGPDSIANFGTLDLLGDVTVTLDTPRTNGNLIFADVDPASPAGWILSGGPLTLAGANPTITVNNLDATKMTTISAVITGQSLKKTGTGTLSLTAANTMAGTNELNNGVLLWGNATALGGISNALAFTGGAIQFGVGAPALNQTNMVVISSATIIATNGNYDNFMASGGAISGDANSVIYVNAANRFTPGGTGGSSWGLFKNFLGTINLTNSTSAARVRMNLGATNIYDLSTVTVDTGTNAGIMYFRTTTAGTVVRIGALTGSSAAAGLQASEQAGNPLLTWQVGFKNTDTVYFGRLTDTDASRRGALLKTGTGRLTLAGTTYTYTGSTAITNGVLALTNSATLTATPAISVISPGIFDVSGLTNGPWSLRTGQILSGSGSVLGPVVLTNGILSPGSNAVATLTFNNLTLSNGVSTRLDVVGPGASDQIVVNGDLTLLGQSSVQLVPDLGNTIITNGTYILFQWTGNLIGDLSNLAFSYPAQLGTFTIQTNNSKQIVLTVSGTQVVNLAWRGDVSGEWITDANWRDTNNAATVWSDGVVAHFDDSGVTKSVDVAAPVAPSRLLMTNNTDYTFGTTGSGKITGTGVIVKDGSGKLTLALDNDSAGIATINEGTLQIGDGGSVGTLTSPIVVNSNGVLALNRADDLYFSPASFSGTGKFVHNGAGALFITNDYSSAFTGITTNSGGRLQIGDSTHGSARLGGTIYVGASSPVNFTYPGNQILPTALTGPGNVDFVNTTGNATVQFAAGATNTGFTGQITINQSVRLQINSAANIPSGPIVVTDDGSGFYAAYFSSAAGATNFNSISIQGPGTSGVDTPRGKGALRLNNTWAGPITLTGNATIGASAGTGTIIGNISDGGLGLTLELFGGTILIGPKTGTNGYGITAINEDYNGNFGVPILTAVRILNSNPFGTGPVQMLGRTQLELNGNNLSIPSLIDMSVSGSGGGSFAPVVLNNATNAPATLTLGSDDSSQLFGGLFGNGSTQPLNLTKVGSGTFTVTGDSTNTGTVTVSAGTLALAQSTAFYTNGSPVIGSGSFSNASFAIADGAALNVTGRTDGTLRLNAGQILKHAGATTGNINITGNVNIGNGTLLLGVNRSGFAHDNLVASGGKTYSGTLAVTNIGAVLQVGDSFQLFPSGTAGFTSFNLQTVDTVNNVKYTWNNTVSTDGKITVASVGPVLNSTPTNITVSVSGSNLTLTWPSDHTGWTLQSQTNAPGQGLGTNWFDIVGSTATNQLVVPINPSGSVFFRMKL